MAGNERIPGQLRESSYLCCICRSVRAARTGVEVLIHLPLMNEKFLCARFKTSLSKWTRNPDKDQ